MRSAFARWNHVNGSLLCLEWDGRQKAPCGDCRKASKGAVRAVGLMVEELNMHFSSVFTKEDTSLLPVPETKFNGSEEERLGQLIVTPEVVASKIKKYERKQVTRSRWVIT